ncbi:MAG: type II toxin-antitoxin system RelE/ParE family toxin [bacterium]|nr:type II toxin-antitoxin system RelE/ParE family toxin [bacterium]
MVGATVVKSASAQRDFRRIYAWIALDGGPRRAERALRRLDKTIERLARRPLLGPLLTGVPGQPRGFSVRPWKIIYRPLPDGAGVLVLRILDSRRDIAALLGQKS